MKLVTYRRGAATNSSSTHSIIYWPRDRKMPREVPGYGEYGWDDFTLTSKEEKNAYWKLQLRQDPNKDHYIDHQSLLALTDNKDELEALQQLLMDPRVIILGGNDNGEPHPLYDPALTIDLSDNKTCRTRKEAWGWTVFSDRNVVQHFRIAKDGMTGQFRSGAPDTVDLHITDQCGQECPWCYQGSTSTGAHADPERLLAIANALAKLGVFEVAIGGGNPLLHPQLETLIGSLQEAGIRPRLTVNAHTPPSKELQHLFWGRPNVALGVSVATAEDVNSFARAWQGQVAAFHVIMGVVPISELMKIKQAIHVNYPHWPAGLLLLGFKATGRGLNHKPVSTEGWYDVTHDDSQPISVAIDTSFARQSLEELKARNIDPLLYSTQEGVWSCFIDAVRGDIAASSWTGKRVKFEPDKLKEAWEALEVC